MNSAFYLDLVSPNGVENLPDSVVVSPRLDMARKGRERELELKIGRKELRVDRELKGNGEEESKREKRVDSGIALHQNVEERIQVQETPESGEKCDLEDERVAEQVTSDQAQLQQNRVLKDEGLGNFDLAQIQQQRYALNDDRLESAFPILPIQTQAQLQRQQQNYVLKDERLCNANSD